MDVVGLNSRGHRCHGLGRRQWLRRQLVGCHRSLDDRGLVEAELLSELGKKSCLGLVSQAIGVADSDGQFERQPACLRSGKNGDQAFQRYPPLQHLREQRGEVEPATERVGNATPLGAFALLVSAVGERGHQCDRHDGACLRKFHDEVQWAGSVRRHMPAAILPLAAELALADCSQPVPWVSPATCGWHRLNTNAGSSP